MADARIVHARATRDYNLWLRFADGLEGAVYVGGILDIGAFRHWRDIEAFLDVRIEREGCSLVWPAGVHLDHDLCWHHLVEKLGPPRRPRDADVAFGAFLTRALGEQDGPIGPRRAR